MKLLRITVPASRDLAEISDYFLASSVDAGERFVEAFSIFATFSLNNCIQAPSIIISLSI